MDANAYIAQGIQHAKSAITFDSQGQLAEALQYYTLTLQSLNSAIQIDTSEARKEVTQKKANEYASRKQQLEARMMEQQRASNSFNNMMATQNGADVSETPPAALPRALPAKPLPTPTPQRSASPSPATSSTSANDQYQEVTLHNREPSGTQIIPSNAPPNPSPAAVALAAVAPGAAPTIGIGNTPSPQAYATDGEMKMLILWVTDNPVHKNVERLRASGYDVLLTQTFAEGMKVLRRNTNITHVVNNIHRAGGKLAATTELINLVNKYHTHIPSYDDMLPIILTTFESPDGKKKKKGGVTDQELNQCLQSGAKCVCESMDELVLAIKDLSPAPRQGANLGPTPVNPQQRFWGKSVYNANNLEYFVGDKIGSGNFGVIHDCRDVFGQDYVCKILKTNRPEEEVQADWAKETQFLYTLNHPNIVQLYDAFRFKFVNHVVFDGATTAQCFDSTNNSYSNLYHMVMERCSGSLRDYVERHGPLSGPDVVSVGGMILAGLHHIHQKNIIHRDLHVDNILYAPPRTASQKLSVKISDFGISKLLRPTENAAVTFIGRDYDYCPELVTKGHTTKRSDIYQCGLVLYHIYSGRHALSAKDGNNVVQIVTSGLARQRAEQLNTKLGDVIGIMLRRAPEYRYKDCVETCAHLYAILEN